LASLGMLFSHHEGSYRILYILQLAQNDLGPSPKIFKFAVCISINPYLDYDFNKFTMTY